MIDRRWIIAVGTALLLSWSVGIFARGFWTPDEPREADLAWRMSWQHDKAVPLLAGDAFCEKPPLTYWVAAAPAAVLGFAPWSVRLPNLLYACLSALGVGLLARRLAGRVAAAAAGAAVGSFLLGYQTLIWLATDAPLLAFVSLALCGFGLGFYATDSRERCLGYTFMHAALGAAFLSKSALAMLVPVTCALTLMLWERRWRELLRWELYAGLPLLAAIVGSWIWFVYVGPEGPARLKIFFWNNLAGRLTQVDAPAQLQYATAHRNHPGKYLQELPLYLWPWTLLVLAAARRAWLSRGSSAAVLRFAVAASLPALLLLSFAATARNVYAAPLLPGFALLLGWWVEQLRQSRDRWDIRALRGTAALLMLAAVLAAAVLTLLAFDSPSFAQTAPILMIIAAAGIGVALYLAVDAWTSAPRGAELGPVISLFAAFCCLLIAPAWLAYTQINRWQDLSSLGAQIKTDLAGRPLLLFGPDETTRAFVDLYVGTRVIVVPETDAAHGYGQLRQLNSLDARTRILAQVDGRELSPAVARVAGWLRRKPPKAAEEELAWTAAASLRLTKLYALPNGRRYALLEPARASAPAH